MGKMEPIDGKQTSWAGLWWHPEYNGFSSACISLTDLRKFKGKVRLYMRKNKFYNGGENGRPNYHFCLKDAESEIFNVLQVEDEEPQYVLFNYDEIQSIINRVACHVGGDSEYGEHLVEDYTDKFS